MICLTGYTNCPNLSAFLFWQLRTQDWSWIPLIHKTVERCPKRPTIWHPAAEGSTIEIDGKAATTGTITGRYATINRKWGTGNTVSIDFSMNPLLIVEHPLIEDTRSQFAVKRGPVVYTTWPSRTFQKALPFSMYTYFQTPSLFQKRIPFFEMVATP